MSRGRHESLLLLGDVGGIFNFSKILGFQGSLGAEGSRNPVTAIDTAPQ